MARRFDLVLRCAAGVAAAIVVGPGCRPPSRPDVPRQPPDLTARAEPAPGPEVPSGSPPAPAWPYWPADLRVHPLSRFVFSGDTQVVLEARVELKDEDGHTTKGVGQLTLDLYENRTTPPTPRALWALDLARPDLNRLHFDEVTRTYLLRLEMTRSQLPEAPVLRAELQTGDGRRLTGTLEIRRR